ncbi:MAG: PD-(D/E)XK nuclease-like domain-containing protein [Synechococcus sp.]
MPATATQTEVFFEQPDWLYRKAEGLSQSEAKEVLKSPRHWQARYGPEAVPPAPTPQMILGKLNHALLLEPETVSETFARKSEVLTFTVADLQKKLTDDGVEFKKSAKKAELEALAFPDGPPVDNREKLSDNDFDKALGMAQALREHPVASQWFDDSLDEFRRYNEVSIRAQHPSGAQIKGRLDRVHRADSRITIVDIKGLADVSNRGFTRQLVDRGYDIQAGWYTYLAEQAWPGVPVEFVFACVESTAPFGVQLYRASQSVIDSGRKKMDQAITLFEQCKAVDHWPGYSPDVQDLAMPSWHVLDDLEALL